MPDTASHLGRLENQQKQTFTETTACRNILPRFHILSLSHPQAHNPPFYNQNNLNPKLLPKVTCSYPSKLLQKYYRDIELWQLSKGNAGNIQVITIGTDKRMPVTPIHQKNSLHFKQKNDNQTMLLKLRVTIDFVFHRCTSDFVSCLIYLLFFY